MESRGTELGHAYAGRAFVYESVGTTWSLNTELTSAAVPTMDLRAFGGWVGLDGGTILVKAASAGDWHETANLGPSGATTGASAQDVSSSTFAVHRGTSIDVGTRSEA